MQGLVRLTYWLGWVFLGLAVVARVLTYTSLLERMIDWNVLPRNFFELAFLSFLVSIASSFMERQKT